MSIELNRRGFLAAAGLAGLGPQGRTAAAAAETSGGIKLGVASYSLREYSRGLAIRCIQQLRTPYVSVKEFHLPYRSSPQELESGRKEFEHAGLTIMSGGNISLAKDDPDDIRRYFEYARMCGMPMMVCAPTHTNLGTIERFVREYNIRIAIHNHGPEDKQFPTPQSVLEVVRNMDPRCGLCMDVGHSARAGAHVVESIAEAGSRLLDMHIKDLRTFEPHAVQCDVGEGIMPIVGIFKQLQKMGYQGCVNLEYEINGDDPLPGMKNSFSYMRGVLAGLNG
ncbi:MAG TPA: sugar phosphate isomerase/epimerase [Bryobacteraceae bacterium]|nr:sugar phosphate isomerase/epimerase [Bryobacteraceae bacterium]